MDDSNDSEEESAEESIARVVCVPRGAADDTTIAALHCSIEEAFLGLSATGARAALAPGRP